MGYNSNMLFGPDISQYIRLKIVELALRNNNIDIVYNYVKY